jgi:hypothetical protein
MGIEDRGFRGVVKGDGVVFEGKVPLPDGTPVLITPRREPTGSPQAVLAAVAAGPKVTEEDVAALLEEIDRGKRPVRFDSPLD